MILFLKRIGILIIIIKRKTVQTFASLKKKKKKVFEKYLQAGHTREELTIRDLSLGSDPV